MWYISRFPQFNPNYSPYSYTALISYSCPLLIGLHSSIDELSYRLHFLLSHHACLKSANLFFKNKLRVKNWILIIGCDVK